MGLKSRLRLISLDPDKISSGAFSLTLPVNAPISGYITSRNVVLGEYAEPLKPLFEIVDINQLQLQLSIYEKDIDKIKVGQEVKFLTSNSEEQFHKARIKSIGRTIDQESKTIFCIAEITDKERSAFVNRTFIKASIIIRSTTSKDVPMRLL